ncbi:MAG: hypothetical protein R2748_03945 [Bryobacterales bacterium]
MHGLFSIAKRSQLLRSRPQRVVILDGAGYIGNILVRRSLEAGRKVTILDRLDFGDHAIRPISIVPTARSSKDFRDARIWSREL